MKMRLVFVLCVALVVMLTASCADKGTTPSESPGNNDQIVVAIEAGPLTLDPRKAVDAYGIKFTTSLLDRGLMKWNSAFELVPDVATSFEMVSNTLYRFGLPEGLKFSDGSTLEADDFLYTYQSLSDASMQSPFKADADRIEKMYVKEGSLFVKMKEPYEPITALFVKGVVPRKVALAKGDDFGKAPVGLGPYRVTRFVPDEVLELERNTFYQGASPKTSKLFFRILKDENVRSMELLSGKIDLMQNAINAELMNMFAGKEELSVEYGPGLVFTYLGFNLRDPALKDIRVRQAIAHSIDRNAIIAHKWNGHARPSATILPQSHWAVDPKLAELEYAYDPVKAAALLKDAGYGEGGKKISLVYKTSTNKDRIETAQLIASYMQKAGIDARVEPYEWGTFFKDIRTGNMQLYSLSWVGVRSPDIYYSALNTRAFPPEGANRGYFSNAKVDGFTDLAHRTFDREKLQQLYFDIERTTLRELPFVPLWNEDNMVVKRKCVTGYSLTPDAGFDGLVNTVKNCVK